MSKPKHTPGPWRAGRSDMVSYDGNGEGPWKAIYSVELEEGVCVARAFGDGSDESCIANARLIASAPDLLEALEEVTDTTNSLLSELEYQRVTCPLCGEDPGEGEDALCGIVKAIGGASSKARAAIAKAKGGEG